MDVQKREHRCLEKGSQYVSFKNSEAFGFYLLIETEMKRGWVLDRKRKLSCSQNIPTASMKLKSVGLVEF